MAVNAIPVEERMEADTLRQFPIYYVSIVVTVVVI
jgi:hypothetical protein